MFLVPQRGVCLSHRRVLRIFTALHGGYIGGVDPMAAIFLGGISWLL
jgi:hypothetical protein